MSAQMAELQQVHFTSVKLLLFDLFSLIDHKFAGGKWAHGFVQVCSFCERDPRQQSKKPAPDFLKVFPLPSAAVILTRGTFFRGCSLQDKKKNQQKISRSRWLRCTCGIFTRLLLPIPFLTSQTAVFSPTDVSLKGGEGLGGKVTCLDLPSMPGARTHCAAHR